MNNLQHEVDELISEFGSDVNGKLYHVFYPSIPILSRCSSHINPILFSDAY